MSVYVDPLMNHGWVLRGKAVKSCHLFADTLQELMRFAVGVWLRPSWLQGQDRQPPFPHFDLVSSFRKRAVKAGAIELSREEAVAKWRNLSAAPALQKLSDQPAPDNFRYCCVCRKDLDADGAGSSYSGQGKTWCETCWKETDGKPAAPAEEKGEGK